MPEQVTLRFYKDDEAPLAVVMPELTGEVELRVRGTNTQSAVDVLKGMLDTGRQTVDVSKLTAADRDTMLAALHRACWGDAITSTLSCEACDEMFDLSFSLSGLQRYLWDHAGGSHLIDNAHVETSEGSVSLPTSREELALASGSRTQAAMRLAAAVGVDPDKMEDAAVELETLAPIIDLELDATCPECAQVHQAAFDIQSFVMQRLLNEREQLLMEIHLIAMTYGWSLSEIVSLPRSTRKSVAELIETMG